MNNKYKILKLRQDMYISNNKIKAYTSNANNCYNILYNAHFLLNNEKKKLKNQISIIEKEIFQEKENFEKLQDEIGKLTI